MAQATTTYLDLSKDQIIKESNLNTILNILKELIVISLKMQKYIIKQDWIKVYELSGKQEKLNKLFDNSISKLDKNNSKNKKEIKNNLHNDIKNKIREYKEIEFINSKLLKDVLYAAKQKVKHYFNNKPQAETYKKDMKQDNNIWTNNPVLLDKIV